MRNKLKCGDLLVITVLDMPDDGVEYLYARKVFDDHHTKFEIKKKQDIVYLYYDEDIRYDCILLSGVLIRYRIDFNSKFLKFEIISSINDNAAISPMYEKS